MHCLAQYLPLRNEQYKLLKTIHSIREKVPGAFIILLEMGKEKNIADELDQDGRQICIYRQQSMGKVGAEWKIQGIWVKQSV